MGSAQALAEFAADPVHPATWLETIAAEAGIPRYLQPVAAAMMRVSGLRDLPAHLRFHPDIGDAVTYALAAGRPVLCDCAMVHAGVTDLYSGSVIETLTDPRVPALAARLGTTRSAAALELWGDRLGGAVVVIGNAPTALFRLLELLAEGAPKPAAILGMPVGFVGAAESKTLLAEGVSGVPFLTLLGRRGGSALAVAALGGLSRLG